MQQTKHGASTISRAVVVVLLVACVTAALGWLYLRWSTPPAAPVLFPPLSTPDKSTYIVSGVAEPGVEVVVKVQGSPDLISTADSNGIFHAQVVFPQIGEYSISTQTKNPKGLTSQPESFKLKVDEKAPSTRVSRNVAMLARFNNLTGYIEIAMPNVETSWLLQESDLIDPAAFCAKLKDGADPVSKYLRDELSESTQQLLDEYFYLGKPDSKLLKSLLSDLRVVQANASLADDADFSKEQLREETRNAQDSGREDPIRLNRLLLEDAYPKETAKVNSRRGYSFITGSQTCSQFITEMFSADDETFSLRASDGKHEDDLGSLFEGSKKEVLVTPSFTIVRCFSRPFESVIPQGYKHILANQITFDMRWTPIDDARDTFSIVLADYSLTAPSVPPILLTRQQAVWTVTNERLALPAEQSTDPKTSGTTAQVEPPEETTVGQPANITVTLNYHPFASPRNLLKLAQLTPYDLVPSTQDAGKSKASPSIRFNSWSLVTFGLSVLFTLPILWAQFLFRKLKKIRSRLRLLLSVCLLPSIYYLATSLSATIYHYDGYRQPLQSTALRFMAPSLFLVALLLYVLFIPLKLLFAKKIWRYGLDALLRGVVYAASFLLIVLSFIQLLKNQGLSGARTAAGISTAIAFLCLLTLFKVAKKSTEPVQTQDRSTRIRGTILLLAAFVGLAYPLYLVNASFVQAFGAYIQSFFLGLLIFVPYLALASLAIPLKRYETRCNSLVARIGMVLFVAYLVGTAPNWMLIPVPFLLALWLFPKLVLAPRRNRELMDSIRGLVLAGRQQIVEHAFSDDLSALLQKSLASLTDKLATGEIQKSEFDERRASLEQLVKAEAERDILSGDITKRETVLNFGPWPTNWSNGIGAAKLSLLAVVPFVLFESWRLLQSWERQPYAHLSFLSRSLASAANWLVSAFFFGYFFPYIQGENGLKKSMRVSLTVILCLSPVWLLSAGEPSVVILRAGQTFFFFGVIGFLCDYYTVSFKLRNRSDWNGFIRLLDAPSLTAFVSALVTMVGVGVTAAVTGEFKGLFTQAIEITIKQLPHLKF